MSEKNMDDLLAQLKEEFEPTRRSRNNSSGNQASQPSQNPAQNAASSASMEKMLNELRSDIESARGGSDQPSAKPEQPLNHSDESNHNSHKYRERLQILIEQDYQMQARKREAKFAEIRKQEEAKIAEQKRRQQELVEAQRREELRERRRKEAMGEKAKQWLQKLDPKSEEGKWFEEFSYSYEDKLQAAIDYLEAMRETGL